VEQGLGLGRVLCSTAMLAWRVLLLTVLVALAALTPTVDAAVFGIHEHVASSSESSTSLSARPTDATPGAHHCDFSMNPGDGGWGPPTSPPLPMAALVDAPSLPAPRHTPLVPVAPPRA
jgi:hypothetical protein